ncbi:insulin growth factor-like family member 3 [Notamacropus eugenii]|uniref:insulin growth factor-like family member 3 n=1 Tax=Notamacropus eugenii TaxID=9315 RepID=UPI003B67AAD8
MASGNYITAIVVSISIMIIPSSSGAPVTPDSQVIMCQPWLLCGMVAYNPQENQCCEDGSVQSLPLHCGPTLKFDPCSQRCCPNSFKKEFIVVNKRSDCKMVNSD